MALCSIPRSILPFRSRRRQTQLLESLVLLSKRTNRVALLGRMAKRIVAIMMLRWKSSVVHSDFTPSRASAWTVSREYYQPNRIEVV